MSLGFSSLDGSFGREVCTNIYVYICSYEYIYIYTYITCVYICVCVYLSIYIYIYIYVRMYVYIPKYMTLGFPSLDGSFGRVVCFYVGSIYMCVYLSIYIYIYVCVCMCVCVYIYSCRSDFRAWTALSAGRCVFSYVCVCVCMYIYKYVHIYIYIYICTSVHMYLSLGFPSLDGSFGREVCTNICICLLM